MTNAEVRQRAIRAGVIAGVVLLYVALQGMIEKFDARNLINNVVTLGKFLLAFPAFLAGYLAMRPRIRRGGFEQPTPAQGWWAGALAGALTGVIATAFVIFLRLFNHQAVSSLGAVRKIFVAVSPSMLSIMTFGRVNLIINPPKYAIPASAVILILGSAALGVTGAVVKLLDARYRRPLLVALVTTFLLALFQSIIPPALTQLGVGNSWLYSTRYLGLTITGSILAFLVSGALAVAWATRGKRVRRRIEEMPEEGRRGAKLLGYAAFLALLLYIPHLIGSNLTQVMGTVGIFALMGLGLNIVVGYAGLLDLGYVAFFAVGAYTMALVTGAHLVTSLGATANPNFRLNLNFYEAVPLVILVAAFIGLLIGAPVLRLRGDYLAIVTLGFGEIARVLVQSDWLKNSLGGAQGLRDVTDAHIGSVSFRGVTNFYYLVLAFCIIAVYVSWSLANSRIGRAWNAMREDEQVAEAMGISTIKYKLLAFAIGAGVGCLSGALFAVKIGSLAPTSFQILVSITALALIILGGMGSIPGVLVGALFLIGLPGFLTEFEEYRLLLYGGVLVGIMILRPQGLIPNVRRMRELTEEEATQDQWLKRTGDASVDASIAVGAGTEPT